MRGLGDKNLFGVVTPIIEEGDLIGLIGEDGRMDKPRRLEGDKDNSGLFKGVFNSPCVVNRLTLVE